MISSSQGEWIRSVLVQYEDSLTRYAAHITGDIERARDVVQDTFLRLCSQKRSWVGDHIAQWLFTVCRNRALDVREKENRMDSPFEVELEAQPAPQPELSTVLEQNEQLSRVLRVVATLPSNQQEVIRLKFQNGSLTGTLILRGKLLNLGLLTFISLLLCTIFLYLLAENIQIFARF
ncbi:MAG: sigma-70 family RNA polymerase sigma factor [Acidobacteria bacterium]|nr:sigma-70 family RNA polymerase sigma factor [Acidobacteriota bacterium]